MYGLYSNGAISVLCDIARVASWDPVRIRARRSTAPHCRVCVHSAADVRLSAVLIAEVQSCADFRQQLASAEACKLLPAASLLRDVREATAQAAKCKSMHFVSALHMYEHDNRVALRNYQRHCICLYRFFCKQTYHPDDSSTTASAVVLCLSSELKHATTTPPEQYNSLILLPASAMLQRSAEGERAKRRSWFESEWQLGQMTVDAF
jgi:hypothetical protein